MGAAAGIYVQTNNTGGNCFCSCCVTHGYLFWVCRSGAARSMEGYSQALTSLAERRGLLKGLFCVLHITNALMLGPVMYALKVQPVFKSRDNCSEC